MEEELKTIIKVKHLIIGWLATFGLYVCNIIANVYSRIITRWSYDMDWMEAHPLISIMGGFLGYLNIVLTLLCVFSTLALLAATAVKIVVAFSRNNHD